MDSDNAFVFVLLGGIVTILLFILVAGYVDAANTLECQRLHAARAAIEVLTLCGRI